MWRWTNSGGYVCAAYAGFTCAECGKPLPPKPARFLTRKEAEDRLIGRSPGYTLHLHFYEPRSGGVLACWGGFEAHGKDALEALRILVAAAEEAPDD